MFKRILILLGAAALGFGACVISARVAGSWSFLPNRDLDKSTSYIRDVLKTVNENYVDLNGAGYESLTRLSLHGMVDSLDPHSQYLESKDNQELEEDLDGEYGGIGVEVEMHKGAYSVISPIPGSPGDKAGIRLGDEIETIDGKAVIQGVPMDNVVDKLRGKPHTHVKVTLLRPSDGRHLDLDLVREVIKVESVRGARIYDGSTGYIQITEFSDHTGEQFDDALNDLLKKGIDSLVIDVRNNPGGLLDAAVEVAEPFFKKGDLIVYTEGRKASDKETYLSETEGDPLRMPVAVLINGDTASAAEIVTGALKDACGAVVVGERSYGKGSVQTIFKLKNGEGLRLTTAHYFTPSGAMINAHGVSPQVEVVMTQDEDRKIERQVSRPDITDPADFKERFGFAPIEDRQLDAALDVLRAARTFGR
ncbi:MAG TPA: S41 family peptidase [Opitutaceae bacterium]|jgi:carboxyl-terminal processing protease|nr:S41 family peptidase [Opitutaceae bacterium]